MTSVSIVRLRMTSATLAEVKEVSAKREMFIYTWTKKKRNEIIRTRMHYRTLIFDRCVSVYGLQVVRENEKENIQKLIDQADAALNKIDNRLHARAAFIDLDAEAKKGEAYEAILNSVRGQIFTELLERLRGIAQQASIRKASKEALLALCDRMKDYNILEEPAVTKMIEEFRKSFEGDLEKAVKPTIAKLEKEIERLEEQGYWIEIGEE